MIELAQNHDLSAQAIITIEAMIRAHEKEISDAWNEYFPG
jgi:hypothetical protein